MWISLEWELYSYFVVKMALSDIYFVPIFLIEVLNNVSCNFFCEGNNFLLLRLIEFSFLRIFDAVSKVVITAISQTIFELNLAIPESRKLFPGLPLSDRTAVIVLYK